MATVSIKSVLDKITAVMTPNNTVIGAVAARISHVMQVECHFC